MNILCMSATRVHITVHGSQSSAYFSFDGADPICHTRLHTEVSALHSHFSQSRENALFHVQFHTTSAVFRPFKLRSNDFQHSMTT